MSKKRRAIGVDFGTKRVGVAITDELGSLAHPRPHLNGSDIDKLISDLRSMAEAEDVERYIVGLPRSLSGEEGPAARRVRRFALKLKKASGRRVVLFDERLSTLQATAKLRDQGLDSRELRSRVDSAAATILLQAWLDSKDRAEHD